MKITWRGRRSAIKLAREKGLEPVKMRWRHPLESLGVPCTALDDGRLPQVGSRRAMVLIPKVAAEVIRAYLDARERRPGAVAEMADLREVTVAQLAAEAYRASVGGSDSHSQWFLYASQLAKLKNAQPQIKILKVEVEVEVGSTTTTATTYTIESVTESTIEEATKPK